jgi:hypothetical protein
MAAEWEGDRRRKRGGRLRGESRPKGKGRGEERERVRDEVSVVGGFVS